MAETLTTRLGLHKATPGTNEPFDTVEFNGDLDKLDSAAGAFECTSGTRPATGNFNGRLIYESDSKTVLVRAGSEWRYAGGEGYWFYLYRNTALNFPTDAENNIGWDTVGNASDLTTKCTITGAGYFTAPLNGIMHFNARASMNTGSNTNTRFYLSLREGTDAFATPGTERIRGEDQFASTGPSVSAISSGLNADWRVEAGKQYTVRATSIAVGITKTLEIPFATTFFQGRYVG